MVKFVDKGTYQVHYPPERLRQKVKSAGGKPLKEIEADSEDIVRGLSVEFLDSVKESVAAINERLKSFHESSATESDRDRIFKHAHDVKDVGGSFGFPLIGEIAALICTMSQEKIPVSNVRADLLEILTQAIDDATELRIRTASDPRATKLLASLANVKPIPRT